MPRESAQSQIISCRKIGCEFEAAVDYGECLRRANARSLILFLHGFSHSHKVMSHTGCLLLGGAKDNVGQFALEQSKRRSVNGMNYNRDARLGSSQPSQDSAFPLWVWTTSGLRARNSLASFRKARMSRIGLTGRTNSGIIVSSPGTPESKGSSEPSAPEVGPEMRSTWNPGFAARPKTEAMVFSWAPPTISRVMTCVTRILACSRGHASKFFQPLKDDSRLVGIRFDKGEIGFVIANSGIGVSLR